MDSGNVPSAFATTMVSRHHQHQLYSSAAAALSSYNAAFNPTATALSLPAMNNVLHGYGRLCWLSSKAGLITCSKPIQNATVSFQLKDFCDQGVTDLTSILRVGFVLSFSATISETSSNEWIANRVSPISDQDLAKGFASDGKEINLEEEDQSHTAPGSRASKDPYSIEKEMSALSFLLSVFLKNNVHFIPLSNLHSRISNSGQEELYRYIGSSSLKRRKFIEQRSYIFHIAENDVVFLQPPEVYNTVCLLAGFLLTHGGVTSLDALFNFFNNCNNIPGLMKDTIANRRPNFIQLLNRHSFAFAPFPSQCFVSVCRNLPYFDYNLFIKKNFPGCVFQRPMGSNHQQPTNLSLNLNQPRPLASAFSGTNTVFDPITSDNMYGHRHQQGHSQHTSSHQTTPQTPISPAMFQDESIPSLLNGPNFPPPPLASRTVSTGIGITNGSLASGVQTPTTVSSTGIIGGGGGQAPGAFASGINAGARNGSSASIWAPNDQDFFDTFSNDNGTTTGRPLGTRPGGTGVASLANGIANIGLGGFGPVGSGNNGVAINNTSGNMVGNRQHLPINGSVLRGISPTMFFTGGGNGGSPPMILKKSVEKCSQSTQTTILLLSAQTKTVDCSTQTDPVEILVKRKKIIRRHSDVCHI